MEGRLIACTLVRLPDGTTAIVCGPRPRGPKCIVCKSPATRLCDGRDPEDVDGVCSAHLCDRHAARRGAEDLCPRHASPALAALFVAPPAAPRGGMHELRSADPHGQLSLFGGRR